MEKLHDLLISYNNVEIPESSRRSWSDQFCELEFPCYWYKVYDILNGLDRSNRIIEIGCGQGDITSIACHLGFSSILAYERDSQMSKVAIAKIKTMFNRIDVIIEKSFPEQNQKHSEILIMVNCIYADDANSKELYIQKIKTYYEVVGFPKWFVLETIDASYNVPDDNFPYHVRLSQADINTMFPDAKIMSWETYQYPQNKTTKRLYLIEK